MTITRLEVVCSQEDEDLLQGRYRHEGWDVRDPSSYYKGDETVLLSPRDLLREIVEATLNSDAGRPTAVTGMAHYLNMWSDEFCRAFFKEMRGLLDRQAVSLVVILQSSAYNPAYIKPPRYMESRALVLLRPHSSATSYKRTVTVADSSKVPRKYSVKNIQGLVSKVCDSGFDGDKIYSVDDLSIIGSDLSSEVEILRDNREILARAWGFEYEVSDDAASELISRCVESGVDDAKGLLIQDFGEDELEESSVLKRLLSLEDDVLFGAYLDCVKAKFEPSSYVCRALGMYRPGSSLEHVFVVEAAEAMLFDRDSPRLAGERRRAIQGLESKVSLVSEFVRDVKNESRAICWLNCDTAQERSALILQASGKVSESGIPDDIGRLYPELNEYLSIGYDYDVQYLTDYFREYRINKLNNTVSKDFLDRVSEAEVPSEVKYRSALVNEYSGQEGVALLMVDGLGAEYMPFLLRRLQKRELGSERSVVVRSELPTSTSFNSIEWVGKKIDDLKGLDAIAHQGKAVHERSEWYENLEASLHYISNDVVNRISEYAESYEKIIVTADHGLTRLAVRASEEKLVSTFDAPGVPDDWRYTEAKLNEEAPPYVIAVPPGDDGKTYWVMRTYDRFNKQGGKKYETHGGASLEEQLVPFIVVTKGCGSGTFNFDGSDMKAQMKESDAFDDLFEV